MPESRPNLEASKVATVLTDNLKRADDRLATPTWALQLDYATRLGSCCSMLRQNPRTQKRGKLRAAVLVGLTSLAICCLLAIKPLAKGRTSCLLSARGHVRSLASVATDDSQNARDRAIALGLVPKGKFPINKADLVSAMPSDQSHLPVVKGSRAWRKVQQCSSAFTTLPSCCS